jgi:hypothetical protein
MGILNITEYQGPAIVTPGIAVPVGQEPALRRENTSFTTAAPASAFLAATNFVRIQSDTDAYFNVGGTATVANGTPIKAGVPEYFGVAPGDVLSIYDGVS